MLVDNRGKQAYYVNIERDKPEGKTKMTNFIIVDNNTNDVIAELENYDFADVVYATDFTAEDERESNDFSVYFVDELITVKVAVFDNGKWYEADGYTVLNY